MTHDKVADTTQSNTAQEDKPSNERTPMKKTCLKDGRFIFQTNKIDDEKGQKLSSENALSDQTSKTDDGKTSQYNGDGQKKELVQKHSNTAVTQEVAAPMQSRLGQNHEASNQITTMASICFVNGATCSQFNNKDDDKGQEMSSEKAQSYKTEIHIEGGHDGNDESSNIDRIPAQPQSSNNNKDDKRSSQYDNIQELPSNEHNTQNPDTPSGTMTQPSMTGGENDKEETTNHNKKPKNQHSCCCSCCSSSCCSCCCSFCTIL